MVGIASNKRIEKMAPPLQEKAKCELEESLQAQSSLVNSHIVPMDG